MVVALGSLPFTAPADRSAALFMRARKRQAQAIVLEEDDPSGDLQLLFDAARELRDKVDLQSTLNDLQGTPAFKPLRRFLLAIMVVEQGLELDD